jgi:undecaprenyl diphosphate synthase
MRSATTVDYSRLPVHVGIIMDGNGRWASQRNLIRTQGHNEGLKAAKRVVKAASDLGIKYLTLYTFSTENWKRTADEVGFLMGLIKEFLIAELDFYRTNGIRIRHTGDLDGLPKDIAAEIRRVCVDTQHFTGLSVILAVNYGGRDEIVRSVKRLVSEGTQAKDIVESAITGHMDNPDVPDPDLIIRTAGEQRTSNFLLWEAAYAEYYFSGKLWPDWTEDDLAAAIADYQGRDRRFGGVKV